MNLKNIIRKKISKVLNNLYLQIFIEYLSVCLLPYLIGTAVFLILLISILIHFGITLITYPTCSVVLYLFLTLVSVGSLWPKYVNTVIKIWENLSFNYIKTKEPIRDLKLCNYVLYALVCFIYSLWYLQGGKCDINVEVFYYVLMTYLGLDNCINYLKNIRINNH